MHKKRYGSPVDDPEKFGEGFGSCSVEAGKKAMKKGRLVGGGV